MSVIDPFDGKPVVADSTVTADTSVNPPPNANAAPAATPPPDATTTVAKTKAKQTPLPAQEPPAAADVEAQDSVDVRCVHPGGVVSAIGEVVVGSVNTADETTLIPVLDLCDSVIVKHDSQNVSLSLEGEQDGTEGTLRLRFIGDFQGRAYALRSDDRKAGVTVFRAAIGHGVL